MRFILSLLLSLSITTTALAQGVLYETYSDSGKKAFKRGQYAESERLFKAALREAEKLNSLRLIADCSVNLGKVYQSQRKYGDAENLYLRAIDVYDEIGDEENLPITYALSNLGLLYAEQKKFQEAEGMLRRALAIRESILEPTDTDIAVVLVNLGKLYSDQEKLLEAESLYDKALKIFVLTDNENLEGIFACIDSLLLIYEKTKDYKKAGPMYRFAIAVLERNNGKNNPILIPYLENYATLLRKLKRGVEATRLEARIKRMRQSK